MTRENDTGLALKLKVGELLGDVTVINAASILDLASQLAEHLPEYVVEPHAEISGDDFDARTTRVVSVREPGGERRAAVAFRGGGDEWILDGVSILPRNSHRIGGPLI